MADVPNVTCYSAMDQALDQALDQANHLRRERWTNWTRQTRKNPRAPAHAHAHHFTHNAWSSWSIRVFARSKGGPRVVQRGPEFLASPLCSFFSFSSPRRPLSQCERRLKRQATCTGVVVDSRRCVRAASTACRGHRRGDSPHPCVRNFRSVRGLRNESESLQTRRGPDGA